MESPDQAKWIAGIAVPLLVAVPGVIGLCSGETLFPSAQQGTPQTPDFYLGGVAGRVMALTFFSFAAVLHLHFFQKTKHPDATWPDLLAKILCVLTVLGLGYSFIHLFDLLAV